MFRDEFRQRAKEYELLLVTRQFLDVHAAPRHLALAREDDIRDVATRRLGDDVLRPATLQLDFDRPARLPNQRSNAKTFSRVDIPCGDEYRVDAGVRTPPPAVPDVATGDVRTVLTASLRRLILVASIDDPRLPMPLVDACGYAVRRAAVAHHAYAGTLP